jgi:2-haloacid dehalogenase
MSASAQPAVVVFDVGKVLLDFDLRRLCGSIFRDPDRMDVFLRDICTPAWVLELDRGVPFAEAVAAGARRFPDYADELRAFDAQWMDIFVGPIQGSVDLLRRLQDNGVRTFCITNFPAEKFERACDRFAFLGSFEGAVVSGRERLVKPDRAIFELLLDRYRLQATECLFIDDVSANVDAAEGIGMHGHRFTEPAALAAELIGHGLLPA